jgi:hypothetical protein
MLMPCVHADRISVRSSLPRTGPGVWSIGAAGGSCGAFGWRRSRRFAATSQDGEQHGDSTNEALYGYRMAHGIPPENARTGLNV